MNRNANTDTDTDTVHGRSKEFSIAENQTKLMFYFRVKIDTRL